MNRGDRVVIKNSGTKGMFLGFGVTQFGSRLAVMEPDEALYKSGPFLQTTIEGGQVRQSLLSELSPAFDENGKPVEWKVVLVVNPEELQKE